MTNATLNEEILKNTPPTGVSTLPILGVPPSDMVYGMPIAYILVESSCTIFNTYVSTTKGE